MRWRFNILDLLVVTTVVGLLLAGVISSRELTPIIGGIGVYLLCWRFGKVRTEAKEGFNFIQMLEGAMICASWFVPATLMIGAAINSYRGVPTHVLELAGVGVLFGLIVGARFYRFWSSLSFFFPV